MRRPTTDTLPDALRHFDQLPDSAHVRQPVVQGLYGFGNSTLWRRVQAGAIPAPVKLGPRTTAWNVGELRRDLAAKRGSR
jgi:predicted DNA-binding transcriptional regulator AlpA